MTEKKKRLLITLLVTVAAVGALVVFTLYAFNNVPVFRSLFLGAQEHSQEVANSANAKLVAQERMEFTGKVSLWIFVFISILQIIALWVGYAVVASIKYSSDNVKLKLRNLENAEVFFDVPLYFGLFGTVSAFLVMTFSPQSSRLIAYSSTLIGIIFSLILRLTMQYPLRKKLVAMDENGISDDNSGDDDDSDNEF